jgi:hypothetical protein
MKHELLPCPFCGGAVSECDESPLYGGSIMHDETECLFKNNLLFHGNIAERWNSRPLEDALRSRIAELEKSAIVWHRFIEGKDEPSESGYYLTLQKISKFHSLVLTEYWVAVPGYWDTKTTITYWAYIPEPPKEEKWVHISPSEENNSKPK